MGLKENIEQAISDFDSIKKAIEDGGVEVPYGTDTKDYASKIGVIKDNLGKKKPYIDTSKMTNFRHFFTERARLNLLENIDTSSGTNFSYMFNSCNTIESVPDLDTSKGVFFDYMFADCTILTQVPNIDTSQGKRFIYMFKNCRAITSVSNLDVSKSENCAYMFFGCSYLETVTGLNLSNCTTLDGMFSYCERLKNVSFKPSSIKYNISFTNQVLLTDESIQSIINGLANVPTTRKLTLHSSVINKLTATQMQTIFSKNWTVG